MTIITSDTGLVARLKHRRVPPTNNELWDAESDGKPLIVKSFLDGYGRVKEHPLSLEAYFLRSLADVPSVVNLVDIAERQGILFIEHVQAPDLDVTLARSERSPIPLQQREKLRILGEIAGTLTQLADRYTLHNDVKPGNVLVGSRVRMIDFEIAEHGDLTEFTPELRTVKTGGIGSPGYMAPERYEGVRSYATDAWGLGAIAHRMEGALPWMIGHRETDSDIRRALDRHKRGRHPRLPKEWGKAGELASELLQYDPDKRPNVKDVFTAFAEQLEKEGVYLKNAFPGR